MARRNLRHLFDCSRWRLGWFCRVRGPLPRRSEPAPADRPVARAVDPAGRRAAQGVRRLPFPQDVRSPVGPDALHRSCLGRQPLRAVRERRGLLTGPRAATSITGGSRPPTSPALSPGRNVDRGRRLELRGRGARWRRSRTRPDSCCRGHGRRGRRQHGGTWKAARMKRCSPCRSIAVDLP